MNAFESPELEFSLGDPSSIGNAAEDLNDSERQRMASHVLELVQIDRTSMDTWLGEAQGFLDKLDEATKASKDTEAAGTDEADSEPQTGLTLAAVIQFTARITGSILSEPDLAKASEPGNEALAKWMSSQLRSVDPDWITDTDPLTLHMAVTGLSWRKRWFDDHDERFRTTWLPCTDVIVNANAKSLSRVPRISHDIKKYPYEIRRSIQMKHWIDYEPRFDDMDPQALQDFYEVDMWLDMDGDGEEEPWVVTIARDDTPQIVKMVPRWTKKTVVDTDDLLLFTPPRRYYAYKMIPDMKGGFFPRGFGWLLNADENAANQMLASIIDTAKSAAENGGISTTGGVGLPDQIELKRNRLNVINADGRNAAEVISMFPAKQVTPGMVSTLEKQITLADRKAGTLNMLENAPASMTATLAKGIIDSGSETQGAVHRRIIGEMTEELRAFAVMAEGMEKLPEGTTNGPIALSADPHMATEMQRSAIAEIYHGMLGLPMVFDVKEAATRYCQTLRLPMPEKLVRIMGPQQPSQAEQVEAAIKLGKNAIDKMKAKGAVIKNVADAVLALSQAGLNAQNAQLVGIEVMKLNAAIQELTQDADDASANLAGMPGMERQPGNASPFNNPPPTPGPGGVPLLSGPADQPGGTGQGGSAGGAVPPA